MDVKSEAKLKGVHPDLVRVIRRAAELHPLTFIVTEGLRTVERQAALVKAGASRTMNSRHITGHAVDLAVKVAGEVRWDWPLYAALAETVKMAAAREKVKTEWGGDWKSFKDGPHFQLPFKDYPNETA
jgi:peptidoglycan L-alanyl-D-glutamate endopeptidase CwlK